MENLRPTFFSLGKDKGKQVVSDHPPHSKETAAMYRMLRNPPPSSSKYHFGDASNSLPGIEFSPNQLDDFTAQYKYSFHAKVLGKKLDYRYFYDHLNRIWSPTGDLEIRELTNGFFLLRLSELIDFVKVLTGIPWLVGDRYIVLLQWTPDFNPSQARITETAIWIRLPDLPVEYYNKQALSQIGEIIGKVVKIDPITERLEKCKFARLSIVLNLDNPLIPCIKINGFWQWIQYEGLHVLCYHCGRVGHLLQDCPYRLTTTMSTTKNPTYHWSGAFVPFTLTETADTSHLSVSDNSQPSLYGPWLKVPPHRGCRNHQPDLPKGSVQLQQEASQHITTSEPDAMQPGSTADPSSWEKFEKGFGGHFEKPLIRQVVPISSVLTPFDQPRPNGLVTQLMSAPLTARSANPNISPPAVLLMNQSEVSPTKAGLLQPSHVLDASISFFCGAMLRSTKQLEVNIRPTESMVLRDHCGLTVFNIEPKISTIDINISILTLQQGVGYQHKISIVPKAINWSEFPLWNALEGICKKKSQNVSSSHKVLSWNCLGAAEPRFMPTMRELIRLHQPSMLLLFKTKTFTDDAEEIIKEIGYSGSYRVEPIDFLGEIWLLWREDMMVEVRSPAPAQVHATVHFLPEPYEWISSEVYNHMIF